MGRTLRLPGTNSKIKNEMKMKKPGHNEYPQWPGILFTKSAHNSHHQRKTPTKEVVSQLRFFCLITGSSFLVVL